MDKDGVKNSIKGGKNALKGAAGILGTLAKGVWGLLKMCGTVVCRNARIYV